MVTFQHSVQTACCELATVKIKGSADKRSAEPSRDDSYSGLSSSPLLGSSNGFAGSLILRFLSLDLGSKSTVPRGIMNDLPSSVAVPQRIGLLSFVTEKQ